MIRVLLAFIISINLSLICYGKQISLEDGRIVFDVPDSFRPLPKEILEIKFPSAQRPQYAVGNENAATTIVYDIKNSPFPPEQIHEIKEALTQAFDRAVPGIAWIGNKIVQLSDKDWIYLEFESNAIDTDIHNIILATDYEDKMLIFNFNSTTKEFKQYEPQFRASIDSIIVK